MYNYNETIHNATDSGTGWLTAICKENGTIYFNQPPGVSSTTKPTSTTGNNRNRIIKLMEKTASEFSLHFIFLSLTFNCQQEVNNKVYER